MGLKAVLPRCDTYAMKRAAAITLLTGVVVAGCLFAANSLIGGGTVRTPGHGAASGTSAGHEVSADVGSKPGKEGDPNANGGTSAAGSGVSFAAVGDTTLGNTPELPSDPDSYLDPVEGQLTGDVVFGNLEGTLTDVPDSPKCGGAPSGSCYAFRMPPNYARYLAGAGFTVMNNANNHSYDFGQAGLDQTLAALSRAGIAHDG